ncbi:MAG TPA: DUF4340 domain-containing protein [Gemmataceae bacterium]|nr:DUF4340 domain-containing protein [Gemmataceae bacterium]
MNFRVTTLFFGLLLTSLWVFGLMIAHRKSTGDRSFVMPSLQGEDIKIDKLVIQAKGEKNDLTFEKINDRWYFKSGKNQVRVEGFRIDGIIRQIKEAKHDETADVSGARIDQPDETVTLFGTAKEEPKEWKFYIGKENLGVMYVGSSDQEGKTFAVSKHSIENMLITNPNALRSRRLFDFGEVGVTVIDVKRDGKELEVKRGDSGLWTIVKPALGFAGFDVEAPPEKKDPHDFKAPPPPQAASGVKALLNSIMNIRVESETDFVALGTSTAEVGLTPGKESLRIAVTSVTEKGEKKESTTEVMLIGGKVLDRKDGTYYYARLLEDEGIFQINGKLLEPIIEAVNEPGKIRSLNIAVFEEPKVDAIVLKSGKEEYRLFKTEGEKPEGMPFPMPGVKAWEMFVGKEKKKVNDRAIGSLLELVQGKKAIVEFLDIAPGVDEKKKDAEWGFDAPIASVAVYLDAIEKEKKDEAKKDDKAKKEEKDKKEEAKKDEKSKDGVPNLKKDAKPAVKLEIGKIEKGSVNVKRTLQDGTVTRFTVKKEFYDKLVPSEGIELALLDLDLPQLDPSSVTALKIERKGDKGMEAIDLVRRSVDGRDMWFVKDPLEPTGFKQADDPKVEALVRGMSRMHVKKWLKTLDSKEDLDKYGLKFPAAIVTMIVKKSPAAAAGAVAVLASSQPFMAMPFYAAANEADKGEAISVSLGKDTENDKDKPGTFATRTDSKLLFLVDARFVKDIRDTDYRDRASLMHVQARQIAAYLGGVAGEPISALLLASPHISGDVIHFDPDKIKEVKLEVRDRFELRTFDFVHDAKAKTWTDKSNIPEFRLDPEKVTQFLKDLSKARTDRFVAIVGGPRGEHRLGAKEAIIRLDLTFDDGKSMILLIGASYLNQGYYARTSTMPEAVFMLSTATVEPMLRGIATFAKERLAAN